MVGMLGGGSPLWKALQLRGQCVTNPMRLTIEETHGGDDTVSGKTTQAGTETTNGSKNSQIRPAMNGAITDPISTTIGRSDVVVLLDIGRR